jgi:hypothetical protein
MFNSVKSNEVSEHIIEQISLRNETRGPWLSFPSPMDEEEGCQFVKKGGD